MAVNSLAVCFAPASGTSSNLGRCRFFTFPARTMALRAAPGLSKRRTDQPLERMDMRIEADAVDVRPALPTTFLFVGEGAGSFSKVKLDHTELGSVLGWRRTH